MAENKKSFIGYVEWGEIFDMLEYVQAGKLIKYLFAFLRGESPIIDDKMLQLKFRHLVSSLRKERLTQAMAATL